MSTISNPFESPKAKVRHGAHQPQLQIDSKYEKVLLNKLKQMEYPLPDDILDGDITVGVFGMHYLMTHHLKRRH